MAKIAVLIENMFEDSEYAEPAAAFKRAGHELIHVGLEKGAAVTGEKKRKKAKVDRAINEVTVNDFDAIFIPGGYSPDRLRFYDDIVAFVREFAQANKPVFFICHGAQLLITADVIKGRKVTGWKSISRDIKNAGAEFIDQEVVEDSNFISSRSPKDIPAFVQACLNKLG